MQQAAVIHKLRWPAALGGVGVIVSVYRWVLHVNSTTVALSLLLFILLLASVWPRRIAVASSVVATAGYNFFFLPPLGTFTVADPQNWLTLFAFLTTALIGSRFSQASRDEATAARRRQRDIEPLLALSEELLLAGEITGLVHSLPQIILSATQAASVRLFLLESGSVLEAGTAAPGMADAAALPALAIELTEPELRQQELIIPLRVGVRPRGLLLLRGSALSPRSGSAAGGLISIALDRARALEAAAHSEATREGERLRSLILDSITHELRTPLTSIKGAAGSLLSSPMLSAEDREELVHIIDEEADRMNSLVTHAVETAQIEAREVGMHPEPVSVAEMVARTRVACGWVFATHPVMVSGAAHLCALADPVMVSKVLTNLLENAAKYSDQGAPIQISAEQSGGSVSVTVQDQGIGIPKDELPFIFERLYRGRARRRAVSGSGMGLALSRAIVQAHSGNLTVVSSPGAGSSFCFTLPACAAPEGVATEQRA